MMGLILLHDEFTCRSSGFEIADDGSRSWI